MSIQSILVPNSYGLFCDSLTARIQNIEDFIAENLSVSGTGTINSLIAPSLSFTNAIGSTIHAGNIIASWDSTITYPSGVLVSYNNALYASLSAGNLNNTPSLASSFWLLLSSLFNINVSDRELICDATTGTTDSAKWGYLPFANLLDALNYNSSPANTQITLESYGDTYSLGLTPYTVNQNGLYISSANAITGSPSNTITGQFIVVGNAFKLEGVRMTSTSAITYEGAGGMFLSNVFFNPGGVSTDIVFQNSGLGSWGGNSSLHNIINENSLISGGSTSYSFSGNPVAGSTILITDNVGQVNISMTCAVGSDYNVIVSNCSVVNVLAHTGGQLYIANANCVGLVSTANLGSIVMRNSSFYNASAGTYYSINKTGNCGITFDNVDRNRGSGSTDVITIGGSTSHDTIGLQVCGKYTSFNTYTNNDMVISNVGGTNRIYSSLINSNLNNAPTNAITNTNWALVTNPFPKNANLSTSPASTSLVAGSAVQLVLPTTTNDFYSMISASSSTQISLAVAGTYIITVSIQVDTTQTAGQAGACQIYAGTSSTYPGLSSDTFIRPFTTSTTSFASSVYNLALKVVSGVPSLAFSIYAQNISSTTFNGTVNAINVLLVL